MTVWCSRVGTGLESPLNVLLITTHFPSGPSGSPPAALGRRWAHLCRETASLGLAWHVVTPGPEGAPQESWEFAPWVRVHHPVLPRGFERDSGLWGQDQGDRGGSRLARLARSWRGLESSRLPDATAAWIEPASRLANALHGERHFGLVVSHGPPVAAHVIGRSVARQARVAWVADWEAPWADNRAWNRAAVVQAVDRKLEADLVRDADGVIAANAGLLAHFRAWRHEIFDDGATLVPQGFDGSAPVAPSRTGRDRLRLVCSDALHLGGRDPSALLEALGLRPDLTARLEVVFVGLEGAWRTRLESLALEYGVSEAVQFHGPVSFEEALAVRASADALLTFGYPSPLWGHEGVAEGAAHGVPVLHVLGGEADASLEQLARLAHFRACGNHRFALAEALEAALAGDWEGTAETEPPEDWRWSRLAVGLARFLEGRAAAHRASVGLRPSVSRTPA